MFLKRSNSSIKIVGFRVAKDSIQNSLWTWELIYYSFGVSSAATCKFSKLPPSPKGQSLNSLCFCAKHPSEVLLLIYDFKPTLFDVWVKPQLGATSYCCALPLDNAFQAILGWQHYWYRPQMKSWKLSTKSTLTRSFGELLWTDSTSNHSDWYWILLGPMIWVWCVIWYNNNEKHFLQS